MNKYTMFDKYPEVVEVDDLRKMLGGISRKLAYKLLAEKEIQSVKVGRTYKIPQNLHHRVSDGRRNVPHQALLTGFQTGINPLKLSWSSAIKS